MKSGTYIDDPSPCDVCPHSQNCADESLACNDYVLFHGGVKWGGKKRQPNRIDYHRVFNDLIVSKCFTIIADVIRATRAENRKPTVEELIEKLGYDRRTTIEILERYKKKQGMVGGIVTESNSAPTFDPTKEIDRLLKLNKELLSRIKLLEEKLISKTRKKSKSPIFQQFEMEF